MTRRQEQRKSDFGYELSDDMKDIKRDIESQFGANSLNDLMYDPPGDRRIPKKGAWVMVVRSLSPIENDMDKKVRPGMLFWAEHQSGADEAGFNKHGYYKVTLHTPWGDVDLWPYEYATTEFALISKFFQDGELVFHPTKMADSAFSDALFYLRSPGLGAEEAIPLVLGTIEGNVGYFEPSKEAESGISWALSEEGGRWMHVGEPIKKMLTSTLQMRGKK